MVNLWAKFNSHVNFGNTVLQQKPFYHRFIHNKTCVRIIGNFCSQIYLSSIWSRMNSKHSQIFVAAAAAKSLQSCPTLCDPIDGSPPGSPVLGILQARTLEWVAISFSNAGKGRVKVKSLSRVRLLATPWSTVYQAPPSMDFPGKSTGVGCHCPISSEDTWRFVLFPDPGRSHFSSFMYCP